MRPREFLRLEEMHFQILRRLHPEAPRTCDHCIQPRRRPSRMSEISYRLAFIDLCLHGYLKGAGPMAANPPTYVITDLGRAALEDAARRGL